MTRGGAGAEAHYAGGHVTVPAVKVKMVDTVGAGDTFNAGLLAALWRKGLLSKEGVRGIAPADLTAALTYAAAAAAITVSRAGADAPWLREMPPLA
jgi:fructokinase